MPTAPLFYQPLVQARVLATKIGDTTVHEAQKVQAEKTQAAYEKHAPAMDGMLRGFEGLQASMPGSKSLDVIQFAYDDAGYIANRVATTMRLHPELFDTASPDQAAEIGARLVAEAGKELSENPGMRAVGDTLEVAPDVTQIMVKHWEGAKPLQTEEAAYLGVTAARELQRAVTPLDADATSPQLQWVEDGTAWMLGMWPGAASKTLTALGIKADSAGVEEIVGGWRGSMDRVEPKVAGPLRSLTALLGAAGITGNDDAARDAAFSVLQGSPLEGVPTAVAQAIVAAAKLPADKAGYFAGRIVESGGSEGNVAGLIAEIEQLKLPPPVPAPDGGSDPVDDPLRPVPSPGTPPPGDESPPPVDPPDGESPPPVVPPEGDTPPPVDPAPADDPATPPETPTPTS